MSHPIQPAERDKTVIFLHIPKAGGTTLRVILESRYPASSQCLLYEVDMPAAVERFSRLPEEERRKLRLIEGHFAFGVHQHVPQPSTYVTLLRDPVDRIASHYHYVRATVNHPLHETVAAKGLSLKDYVTTGISVELDNFQTRALSDRVAEPFGTCTTAMLDRAKENLDKHFAVVGLLDRFDETLVLLRRTFGWAMPLYVRQNVTADRPAKNELDRDTVRAIEKQNELDVELCAYARRGLERKIKAAGASFGWEVRAFRTVNQAYGRLLVPAARFLKHMAARLR